MSMVDDATAVLRHMAGRGGGEHELAVGLRQFDGHQLADGTGMEPGRINDAISRTLSERPRLPSGGQR
jgi:hypothetical protein